MYQSDNVGGTYGGGVEHVEHLQPYLQHWNQQSTAQMPWVKISSGFQFLKFSFPELNLNLSSTEPHEDIAISNEY